MKKIIHILARFVLALSVLLSLGSLGCSSEEKEVNVVALHSEITPAQRALMDKYNAGKPQRVAPGEERKDPTFGKKIAYTIDQVETGVDKGLKSAGEFWAKAKFYLWLLAIPILWMIVFPNKWLGVLEMPFEGVAIALSGFGMKKLQWVKELDKLVEPGKWTYTDKIEFSLIYAGIALALFSLSGTKKGPWHFLLLFLPPAVTALMAGFGVDDEFTVMVMHGVWWAVLGLIGFFYVIFHTPDHTTKESAATHGAAELAH